MNKMEVLSYIQKLMDKMQRETDSLEKNISCLVSAIEAKQFLPEESTENIINHLHIIREIQVEFKKGYLDLVDSSDFPLSINTLKSILDEKAHAFSQTAKYIDAWKTILCLASDDEECMLELASLQSELSKLNVYALSLSECQIKLQKFVDLISVYREVKPLPTRKLIEYTVSLDRAFGDELSLKMKEAITTGTPSVFLREETEVQEVECSIENATNGNHEPKSEDIVNTGKNENQSNDENIGKDILATAINKDIAEDKTTEVVELVSDVQKKIEENHALISIADNSGKKAFGVKTFKNDIDVNFPIEKKAIIKCSFNYGCITVPLIRDFTTRNEEVIQSACEYLVRRGYLKSYSFNGIDTLYCLSAKGIQIFNSADGAAYLKEERPTKIDEVIVKQPIEAVLQILMTKVFNHVSTINGSFNEEVILDDNSLILQVAVDDKVAAHYTSIIGKNSTEDYINALEALIEKSENKNIYLLGYDEQHIAEILPIINNCTNGIIAGYYNFSSDEWHNNMEENELTSMENGDKETGQDVLSKDEQLGDIDSESGITADTTEKVFSDAQQVSGNNDNEVKTINEKMETEITPKTTSNKTDEESKHKIVITESQDIKMPPVLECIISEPEILDKYQQMLCADKFYCATAYLKAAACYSNNLMPVYNKLAYAVNDPLAKCRYDSATVMELYFDEVNEIYDYFMVSALLRNFFMDHSSYDYGIHSLHDTAKTSSVLSNNASLNNVIYQLLKFKEDMHHGIDKYADYRVKDKRKLQEDLKTLQYNAQGYYRQYFDGHVTENGSNKRFIETQKLIFSPTGELGEVLKVVVDNDTELLGYTKNFLLNQFIKNEVAIDPNNIDKEKMDAFIDEAWEVAASHILMVKKTQDLIGSFRRNLFNKIEKILAVICEWVLLQDTLSVQDTDSAFVSYQKVRKPLLDGLTEVKKSINEELMGANKIASVAGRKVLEYTVDELISRLDGSYNVLNNKYFYVGFLKNFWVLLDDEYLPDVKTLIHELADFSPVCRIEKHYMEQERTISECLDDIKSEHDNYGSAKLLLNYLKDVNEEEYTALYSSFGEALKPDDASKRARKLKEDFIECLELAQSYGQIDTSVEDKKEKILQSVNEWFERCAVNSNFGFFEKIIIAFKSKIKEEAKSRETSIRYELDNIVTLRTDLLENEYTKERISKIDDMIKQQNYTVAEDLMNRLENDENEAELEALQRDYLEEFIHEYDVNYFKVNNAGKTVRSLISIRDHGKDAKGGSRLINAWLSNGNSMSDAKIKDLMIYLGFMVDKVKALPPISTKIENYDVTLSKPKNGHQINYKHSIAAFGSNAVESSFRVVCLYGKFDAESLINTFKEIGSAKHALILLDYALTPDQRRCLARKTKSDTSEKFFGVIDRVVLMHLASHYSETLINRMLMSVITPYTYYQPYLIGAVNSMPPELFIGRKEELFKIESPTGVNIVYGGRQLGKSALLRMAKTHINNDENGNRAVFVDVKGLDYKEAARKISQTMVDDKILENNFETDSWTDLARAIKKRLADDENKIPYLLLLIDEADVFIASCKPDYRPFDALKDIQSVGNGRFKFVVAGLRNVVRFNKEVLNNNSVLAHLSALTVTPFKFMEAKELLEIPLSYLGLRFREKEALVSMILATTNYFPGLIQLYCYKLVEAMKKDYAGYNESNTPPYDVQEKHIKKTLAEDGFQKDIREKFMITLKVDEDCYYHIIAILMAYLYHQEGSRNGYTPVDILQIGGEFGISKITKLSVENVKALMEELRELNVLRLTADNGYLFTRYSFFQMMGNTEHLEDDIMQYMES